VDCGAQINAAYAALPSAGGEIIVDSSCSFSTPIVFGTPNKVAMLQCYGNGTTLTYTVTSGTAVTFNNGANFDLASSLESCTLSGPGHTTSAVGLLIGGTNGAVGFHASHFLIQSFGTNLTFNNLTWVTKFDQGMFRDGGYNVLIPSGLSASGENIEFDHVTFA